jgi:hypothetical protein
MPRAKDSDSSNSSLDSNHFKCTAHSSKLGFLNRVKDLKILAIISVVKADLYD